jgi:hypothetical protein
MPLPSPKGKQKEDSFVQKCMSSETMTKEYPNDKQRVAVCYSQYKQAKKKSKASEEPEWDESKSYIIIS